MDGRQRCPNLKIEAMVQLIVCRYLPRRPLLNPCAASGCVSSSCNIFSLDDTVSEVPPSNEAEYLFTPSLSDTDNWILETRLPTESDKKHELSIG